MSRKRKVGVDSDCIYESWSRTEQYKVKGRHFWTIDDFMRRAQNTEVGDSLCSPVFEVPVEGFNGEQQMLNFQLEVFPNGEEGEDNSDYVAVFLTSRRQEDLEVKYDFSVLKADNTFWGRIGNTFKKFSPEQNSWGYGKAFSKAKLQEKASELLPNSRLTIVCNLEIYYSDRHTEGKKQKLEVRLEDTPSLGDNLEQYIDHSSFSDVTIAVVSTPFGGGNSASTSASASASTSSSSASASTAAVAASCSSSDNNSANNAVTGGDVIINDVAMSEQRQQKQPSQPQRNNSKEAVRRFRCHKIILAARSDVFAAMFSHRDTTEAMTNEIRITDIEPEVMELLLQFVYSEKITSKEALATYASSLLTAADKYNIPRLKAICEETMCDSIDVNNAAEMLGLAYLHEAKNLQAVAVEFVTNNMEKVSETTGWKTISETQPKILNEVLMSVTARYKLST